MTNNTETVEQKKRRLYGRQHLVAYLKELNAITNKKVDESMLLSIVDSDKVNSTLFEECYKTRILFSDKEKLLLLIGRLISLKDGKIYLYTSYSEDCGLLKLDSLKDFNVNFNFNDEHYGLIIIILQDLSNKLILDFYEEKERYYLEIEAYGGDWSKLNLDQDCI